MFTVKQFTVYLRYPVFKPTYAILSCSSAHCPTALVTLTSNAWFVPVSRLTSGGMPPDLRICNRFGVALASSPRAPTTFTKTWNLRKIGTIKHLRCIFARLQPWTYSWDFIFAITHLLYQNIYTWRNICKDLFPRLSDLENLRQDKVLVNRRCFTVTSKLSRLQSPTEAIDLTLSQRSRSWHGTIENTLSPGSCMSIQIFKPRLKLLWQTDGHTGTLTNMSECASAFKFVKTQATNQCF